MNIRAWVILIFLLNLIKVHVDPNIIATALVELHPEVETFKIAQVAKDIQQKIVVSKLLLVKLYCTKIREQWQNTHAFITTAFDETRCKYN